MTSDLLPGTVTGEATGRRTQGPRCVRILWRAENGQAQGPEDVSARGLTLSLPYRTMIGSQTPARSNRRHPTATRDHQATNEARRFEARQTTFRAQARWWLGEGPKGRNAGMVFAFWRFCAEACQRETNRCECDDLVRSSLQRSPPSRESGSPVPVGVKGRSYTRRTAGRKLQEPEPAPALCLPIGVPI